MSLYRCAACGSSKVMPDIQDGGISFNFAKGALGDAILGPGGAVAGLQSSEMQVFKCPDCGISLTYPMADSIRKAIDLGVNDLKSREYLIIDGYCYNWDYLQAEYKNIESGPADREAKLKVEKHTQTLLSVATATKEEFDTAVDHIRNFKSKQGQYDSDKYRHLSTTDIRFSKDNPPDVATYLDYLSATKTIVHNLSKFLPPPIPNEYHHLRDYSFEGLFISYLLNEIRYSGYEKYDLVNESYRYIPAGVSEYSSKFVDYIEDNPFVLEFLKLYQSSFYSPYSSVLSLLDSIPLRRLGSNLTLMFESIVSSKADYTDDYTCIRLYENSLYPGSELTEIVVPKYKLESGKLFTWDTPRIVGECAPKYLAHIQSFFKNYPSIKKQFDTDIETHKQDLKSEEKYNSLSALESSAAAEIKKIDQQISSNENRIKSLSSKIFGKEKAQKEAEHLKKENTQLNKTKKSKEEEIQNYNNFRKEFKPPAPDLYYFNRLFCKYDYLIDWQWVEPKALLVEKTNEQKADTINGYRSSQPSLISPANEIREYKKLLDDGIITQEEFDAKKKQLLGIEATPNLRTESGAKSSTTIPVDCWKCPMCGRINKNHLRKCKCGSRKV